MGNTADGHIADEVIALATRHGDWTANQIHRELLRRHDASPQDGFPEGIPSLRTVQRWLKRLSASSMEPGDSWTMTHGTPADAAAVLSLLPTFQHWILPSRRPTIREADIMVRIRAAAPDLVPEMVCWLAVHGARNYSTSCQVEDYVAYRPWSTDPEDKRALRDALNAGAVSDGISLLSSGPALAKWDEVEGPDDLEEMHRLAMADEYDAELRAADLEASELGYEPTSTEGSEDGR